MKIEVKGISRLKKSLDPRLLERSLSRGLNETARTALKEASQAVRGVYNIKAGDLKKSMHIKRASARDLVVVVDIRSKPLPLYAFGGRAYIARRKGQKIYFGASAKVMKTSRRKKYRGAFVAKMKTGHVGIYRRKGRGRLPMTELRMISATTMFRKYGTEKIEAVFERVFIERVMRDYRYRLQKAGA